MPLAKRVRPVVSASDAGREPVAGARAWLPLGVLLAALSTVFLFAGERGYLYSFTLHNENTAKNLALARNLSAERGFTFFNMRHRASGEIRYDVYNRFPFGAFVLLKLAMSPFAGDSSAQIVAARVLMLAFFFAAAVLAYLALARLTGSRAVALAATLLGFSSYHLLGYKDIVSNEMSVDLFALMLVFHGLVVFEGSSGTGPRGGKRLFGQLVAKVCAALLLGWHVYGLLAPFLALGIGREIARAWRGGAAAGQTLGRRARTAAGRALRSRYALLGAVAVLVGSCVLGYNFAREYEAYGGQRAVTTLPSVRSMLRRVGVGGTPSDRHAPEREWPTFLKWQFHRAGVMLAPFPLAAGVELDEKAWRATEAPWWFFVGVAAAVGCVAGLARFPRRRLALAALASSGFCWALLAPGQTAWAGHQYETLFYVGVPLCLFATLLLGARRLWGRWMAAGCVAAAVLLFAASSVAAGRAQRDAGAAETARARLAEFDAIAEMIRGKKVWIAAHPAALEPFVTHGTMIHFVTAGSFVYNEATLAADPEALGALDFVLAFDRYDIPALLTRRHRFVFLYRAGADAGAVLAARRDARRWEVRRLRAVAPLARSGFDIRFAPVNGPTEGEQAGVLAYLKTPCTRNDTWGRFYLRMVPVNAGALPRWQAHMGFEHWDFLFDRFGVVFDDLCLLRVPLPPWPVANVYTGQWHPAGGAAAWRTAFRLDRDRLRGMLRAVRRQTPSARGEFDVYLGDGALRYVRAPCAAQDVRRRFFLHIVPADLAVLPERRQRRGFDNLDFDFGEHGAVLDEGCVAALALPDYPIARVYTGQFEADGDVAWRVELRPPAGT